MTQTKKTHEQRHKQAGQSLFDNPKQKIRLGFDLVHSGGVPEKIHSHLLINWTIPAKESANIEGFAYSVDDQILGVKFKNGNVYTYAKVPKDVYNTLITIDQTAESLGKWILENIIKKKGLYPFQKEN